MLLAAGFPPWPDSHLLRQPGRPWLPKGGHIDAELSADAHSTWEEPKQNSPPQAIQRPKLPSRRITGLRHQPQLTDSFKSVLFVFTVKVFFFFFQLGLCDAEVWIAVKITCTV